MNDDVLEMLANSATTFAKSDPDRARRFRGQSTGFDRQAWRNIASQGWLSVLIPEERNGLGLGVAAAAVIARVLGRASLPEPFVATGVLAMACMGASESSEPWRSRLAQIMSGDSIVSVAWQDDRGSIDIGHSGVTGIKSKLGYELTGASRFVAVPRADAFIVYATGEDALVWVPADAPGLEVRLECCPDGSALAWLQFRQVTLPAEARLSRAGEASSILRTALDAALVANAAELLGIMDGALDMTLKYLRTRKQFGVPIGSYQSLQHRAVDLWIARELSEAAIHGRPGHWTIRHHLRISAPRRRAVQKRVRHNPR